jgi:ubiquinone/menaquinone biosynthesis C-methylase UbiE
MDKIKKVKKHYENSAVLRDERLKTNEINLAKLNHKNRLIVIDDLLKNDVMLKKGIDVGTGTGVWAEFLTRYCRNVVGIDFAEHNIKLASKNAANLGLTDKLKYFIDDAAELTNVHDDFDVATHISVLQHLESPIKGLTNVNRILSKNSYLIMLVHNKNCIYNRNLKKQKSKDSCLPVNKYYSLEEYETLLKDAGFNIEKISFCWLFIQDFILIGSSNKLMKPFIPIRIFLMEIHLKLSRFISRFKCFNPLYREIVFLAKKK